MNQSLFQVLRRAVLAGLLVVVPAAVTVWVLGALVQILDAGIYLIPRVLQPHHPAARSALGVFLALCVVVAVGLATQSYIGARAVRVTERTLSRVPLLSSIYNGVKQLLEAVFTTDKSYFEHAVYVEWPRRGIWVVAFHTGEAGEIDGRRMINLFMPTTPNPTTGFYFIAAAEDVVFTDLTVEEAFKLIVSAGIVLPARGIVLPGGVPQLAVEGAPRLPVEE